MRPKPKLSALEKKIKPNPRYNGVEPVVNTGANLRTELEKLDEIHQFYKFRNDEVFRRITVNNLVSLMTEVGKLEHQLDPEILIVESQEDDQNQSFGDDDENDKTAEIAEEEEPDIDTLIRTQFDRKPPPPVAVSSRGGTARSATSVMLGVGELDKTQVEPKGYVPHRPFLILDVRDPDLYSRAHISLAVNYPAIRLNRAFDYETREMLDLKNKAKGVIILYDDDESIANKCATTLTQRGYDNVLMLSGGLRVAELKYPEALITDREILRIEEGDIMVLEKLLEDNIIKGSSRMTGSRLGSRRSNAGSMRSTSLDRATNPVLDRRAVSRKMAFDAPMRTSTALGKKLAGFL